MVNEFLQAESESCPTRARCCGTGLSGASAFPSKRTGCDSRRLTRSSRRVAAPWPHFGPAFGALPLSHAISILGFPPAPAIVRGGRFRGLSTAMMMSSRMAVRIPKVDSKVVTVHSSALSRRRSITQVHTTPHRRICSAWKRPGFRYSRSFALAVDACDPISASTAISARDREQPDRQ